jgi:hypothetical protein
MPKTSSKGRQRTAVSSANPRSYSELLRSAEKKEQSSVVAVKPTPAPAPAPAPRPKDKVDWNAEYSQVFKDVRQLVGISAILFIVMIILGLVI